MQYQQGLFRVINFYQESRMNKGVVIAMFWLAANTGYAEYVGSAEENSPRITVAEAKLMRDDSRLSLDGFITGHLRGDHYLFRDDSGEIDIEIEKSVWRQQAVGPDTGVRIDGEVEHESGSVYIDVHRLEVAGPGR
ncbi:MAG: DNA-binding protein [Prosthecochloris sp.]|nr:DNA-binding protein [Prosthecochloris sp.]